MLGLLYIFLLAQTPEDIMKSLGIKGRPKTQPQTTQTIIQTPVNIKDSIIIKKQMEESEIEKMYNNYRLAFIEIRTETITIDSTMFGGRKVRKEIVDTITLNLKQFGYNHFYWNLASYSQPGVMATDNYIIGPGDALTLNIWGTMEKTENLVVNNEGKIFITGVGTLNIAGLKYSEARDKIKKAVMSKFSNVSVDVTLSALRTVNIFLTGEVYAPGNYPVSPLSSILYALYLGGGPTKKGSLRRIKIIRRDGTTIYVDLYDYFVKGKSVKNIQFNDGDIIFVPPIGKTVAVGGAVVRPGIYELKSYETASDVFRMAGGLLPEGYVGHITIEGIENHNKRIIYEKDFSSYSEFKKLIKNLKPSDGDFFKIDPIARRRRAFVYVGGNVYYPGVFALDKKTTLKSLLIRSKIKEDTYMERGEILRYVSDSLYSIIPFNVESVLTSPSYDTFKLMEWDSILVFSIDETKPAKNVYLYGAVKKPGTYKLLPGMTTGDLLFGGIPLPTARLDNAELLRKNMKDGTYSIIPVDLTTDKGLNLPLQIGDNLIIKNQQVKPDVVIISGEVKYPGKYALRGKETLRSLIERAGGLTPNAYLDGVVLERKSVKEMKKKATKELITSAKKELIVSQSSLLGESIQPQEVQVKQNIINQQLQLIKSVSQEGLSGRVALPEKLGLDIILEAGDSIFIPRIPSTVQIIGAVYNPTGVLYRKDLKIKDVIEMAGGFTPDADRRATYVVRASGESVKRVRKLKPGDTVVVPRKSPVQKTLFDTLKDLALIVYQIGVAVAALNTLRK